MLRALFEAIAGLDPKLAATRFRRAIIDFAFAGAALLIGFGFLIAAAFIFLAERYGPLNAALGLGLAFVVLSGVILIAHRTVTGLQTRRRAREQRADQLKSFATAAAFAALPALIRSTGVVGQIAIPLAAMAAYAIYRENAGRDEDDPGLDE